MCLTYFYNRIPLDIPNLFIRFVASFLKSKNELVAVLILEKAEGRVGATAAVSEESRQNLWSEALLVGPF